MARGGARNGGHSGTAKYDTVNFSVDFACYFLFYYLTVVCIDCDRAVRESNNKRNRTNLFFL